MSEMKNMGLIFRMWRQIFDSFLNVNLERLTYYNIKRGHSHINYDGTVKVYKKAIVCVCVCVCVVPSHRLIIIASPDGAVYPTQQKSSCLFRAKAVGGSSVWETACVCVLVCVWAYMKGNIELSLTESPPGYEHHTENSERKAKLDRSFQHHQSSTVNFVDVHLQSVGFLGRSDGVIVCVRSFGGCSHPQHLMYCTCFTMIEQEGSEPLVMALIFFSSKRKNGTFKQNCFWNYPGEAPRRTTYGTIRGFLQLCYGNSLSQEALFSDNLSYSIEHNVLGPHWQTFLLISQEIQ